jgi:hypothetical protein
VEQAASGSKRYYYPASEGNGMTHEQIEQAKREAKEQYAFYDRLKTSYDERNDAMPNDNSQTTTRFEEPISYTELCRITLDVIDKYPEEKTRKVVDCVHRIKAEKKLLIECINKVIS